MRLSQQKRRAALTIAICLICGTVALVTTPSLVLAELADVQLLVTRQQPSTALTSATVAATFIVPTIAPADENAGALIPTSSAATTVPTTTAAPTGAASTVPPTETPSLPKAPQPSGELPETAATVPLLGVGLLLIGGVLLLHATRRVRQAEAELRAKAAVGRLAPFVRAAVQSQHESVQMLTQAQELLEQADKPMNRTD